jgi:pimeloyl-ACP methyl ester carboxylesterase
MRGGLTRLLDVTALTEHFDVLAVDLPGFGDSEPLPAQVEPHPAALAATVASFLDDLGITAPTSPETRSAAGSHWNSPASARSPR